MPPLLIPFNHLFSTPIHTTSSCFIRPSHVYSLCQTTFFLLLWIFPVFFIRSSTFCPLLYLFHLSRSTITPTGMYTPSSYFIQSPFPYCYAHSFLLFHSPISYLLTFLHHFFLTALDISDIFHSIISLLSLIVPPPLISFNHYPYWYVHSFLLFHSPISYLLTFLNHFFLTALYISGIFTRSSPFCRLLCLLHFSYLTIFPCCIANFSILFHSFIHILPTHFV